MIDPQSGIVGSLAQKGWPAKPRDLILLFGSNPLPPVLAALLYGARQVHVITSAQVRARTDKALNWLKQKGIAVGKTEVLEDAQSPAEIAKKLEPFFLKHPGDLHYSGGTKAMAVHAHRLWRDANVQRIKTGECLASWLSSDGRFYFDDPSLYPYDMRFEPALTLEDLWHLHRLDEPTWSDEHIEDNKREIAHCIAELHKKDADFYRIIIPRLYGIKEAWFEGIPAPIPVAGSVIISKESRGSGIKVSLINLGESRNFGDDSPFLSNTKELHKLLLNKDGTFDQVVEYMTSTALPKTHDDRRKARLNAAKWLYGDWLEVWLADVLSKMTSLDDSQELLFDEVRQDVKIKDNPEALQLDVVAIKGHRVFLFSCTVDQSNSIVKSKLMESRMRAEQMGGDLARFAVFSFHKKPENVLLEVRADGFDGYSDAHSFGWNHFNDLNTFTHEVRRWVLK